MLDNPRIVHTTALETAVIRLTVPRSEIRTVMGPAIAEVRAVVAAQGIAAPGAWFTYHRRMDPAVFDFEVGVPVSAAVVSSGRVMPGQLPATTVARTVYRGPYEGLPGAWSELAAWIAGSGHTSAADLWEFYTVGPETSTDSAAWRTELNQPLARHGVADARALGRLPR